MYFITSIFGYFPILGLYLAVEKSKHCYLMCRILVIIVQQLLGSEILENIHYEALHEANSYQRGAFYVIRFWIQLKYQLFFGKDAEEKVGAKLKHLEVSRVLLHYGSCKSINTHKLTTIKEDLIQNGVSITILNGVKPNPDIKLIYKGQNFVEKKDFILVIGGRSVIDSAKAIAADVCYDGGIWDTIDKA